MICKHCSSLLPSDSLFCGECGRAVSNAHTQSVRAGLPPLTAPIPQPEPWMNASAIALCQQCGQSVAPDDIFCGECGFVVSHGAASPPQPRDTNVIERLEQVDEPEPEREPERELAPEPKPAPEPEPEPDPDPSIAAEPTGLNDFDEDVEATRIVQHRQDGERFVLQFSTGESFTVYGSGLIGRSPKPEPGEYFDQMVRIIDASRSVSKTHLEFGQEAGSFWVKDRFSGNGTIIREPESSPARCRPERRYRLVRGSRVDLGEQFFIVS